MQGSFDVEADAKFVFDRGDQGNVRQGIPVINIVRSGLIRQNNAFIIEHIPENSFQFL